MSENMESAEGLDDLKGKRIFTTGEAARLCKVSQQTIIRCFDNGRLTGFKVPGSKFRRIPREELVRFMRENGMPLSALGDRTRVLLVDDDSSVVSLVRAGLEKDGRFEVESVGNGFDAGAMAVTMKPDVMVLDVMLPDIDGAAVCRRTRTLPALRATKILCISATADARMIEELKRSGSDGFLAKPFSVGTLVERVALLSGV
jgi:excisionase family DNA binding protein